MLYLYFRKEMSWTHVEYTRYTTAGGLAGTLSQGLLVPFLSTKLKWQDTTIMAFGAASVVVNQVFITFARAEWVLYLGLLFGCHGWCTSTLCRSLLSKVHVHVVRSSQTCPYEW